MVHTDTHFAEISSRARVGNKKVRKCLKKKLQSIYEWRIGVEMRSWVVCNNKGSLSSRVEKLAHINTGFSQSSHNSFLFCLLSARYYSLLCFLPVLSLFVYSLLLQFPFFLFSTHWLLTFHSSLQLRLSLLRSSSPLLSSFFSVLLWILCFFGSFSASFTPSIGRCLSTFVCLDVCCLLAGQKTTACTHTNRSDSYTFSGSRGGEVATRILSER